jgi:alpha-tubulin suppressor-like RCC1 family protein
MGDDSRFPIAKDNNTGLYWLREPGPQGLPLPGGRATHIAAGDGGFAAMADGSVFGWKTWSTLVSPSVQVGRVRALAAVGDAGCAVTEEGTVVSLTTGKVLETLSDVTAISYSQGMGGLLAARGDGSVVKTGYALPEPPTDLRDVVAVAAGASHCLALTDRGQVIAWGGGEYGQAEVPAGLTNVVAIDAGYNHSLALRGDGTVVGWGSNESGSYEYRQQCGQSRVPAGLTDVVAISAGHSHSVALRKDGTVVEWGGRDPAPFDLDGVIAVSSGSSSTLALMESGAVVGWGPLY